ncbi:hypothetical protein [Piscinibacter sp.]|uniref:hypothetical protein n=1 Tax=Piscinibacter sp. TaxID=1903157 RepID=UPI0039E469F2
MKPRGSNTALLLLLMALGAFVWRTSAGLPPVVASHFGADGAADGAMARGSYLVLMLLLVVGLPLLIGWLVPVVAGGEGRHLNIPNRAYWLAPERRAATLAFVYGHLRWFAAAVALFLAYVHLLVVRANAQQPPQLSFSDITGALLVFFLALAAWMAVLWARLRRRDS